MLPRMRMLRIVLLALLAVSPAAAQMHGDWPLHNLDAQNSRFSPLTLINTRNADKLVQKWQIDLPSPSQLGAATPVVVRGVMYFNSGQTLHAVDGATGKTRWTAAATSDFPVGGRGPV